MWNPAMQFPFIEKYCAEHGPEEFFATFFDENDNLLPDAPDELRKEIALMRGEEESTADLPR